MIAPAHAPDATESRQEAFLDAAVGVFARYGFRKTSMDEVARAAGVSRQCLYLQFADKEALFRKAVIYKLTRQLQAATAALSKDGNTLESRLIAACDEWAGRYVGVTGADAAVLMCGSTTLVDGTLSSFETQFEQALAQAIDRSPLAALCTGFGVSAVDIARAVHAAARGLKQSATSRQEFIQGITVTARMFCAPLARHSDQE